MSLCEGFIIANFELIGMIFFGVAQRKRGGPITLRSLDRNQAPKLFSQRTLPLRFVLPTYTTIAICYRLLSQFQQAAAQRCMQL